jgi:hypothetical protein
MRTNRPYLHKAIARLAAAGGVALAVASAGLGVAGAATSVPERLTKAQAKAVVGKITLRSAELPGFKAKRHGHERETAAQKRLNGQLNRCVGVGPERSLAKSESPEFTKETKSIFESAQADVTVTYTAAEAVKELTTAHTPRARACLKRYFTESFKSEHRKGAALVSVSVVEATPPALGTTASVALRVTTVVADHGIKVPIYSDIIAFSYGPAEIALTTSSGIQPFPAALEERLYKSLAEQAQAAV